MADVRKLREAVGRVSAYLDRRQKDRGADQDCIHSYDVGAAATPDGVILRASDLRAILRALEGGGSGDPQ